MYENKFVKQLENSSDILVFNSCGESIKLNAMEFQEILKAGERINAIKTIDSYLQEHNGLSNIPAHIVLNNKEALNLLTDAFIRSQRKDDLHDAVYDSVRSIQTEFLGLLNQDFLNEIASCIDAEKDYAGMSGKVLSNSNAAKNLIAEYIIFHRFDESYDFSDKVLRGISSYQFMIKEALEKESKISLDEKIKDADVRSCKSANTNVKSIEKPMERE